VVQWDLLTARLVRPNLECTNGYIHVIDNVLMRERDVYISGTGCRAGAPSRWAIFAATVAALLFCR
jgi:hypothetical protein